MFSQSRPIKFAVKRDKDELAASVIKYIRIYIFPFAL